MARIKPRRCIHRMIAGREEANVIDVVVVVDVGILFGLWSVVVEVELRFLSSDNVG